MNLQNAASSRKVLVVALGADGTVPLDLRGAAVLVIAPAFNSRLRHWLSDDDPARRRAADRLAAVLGRLSRAGVHADGRVGDADPMLAISDALRTFPADEIVFAGAPDVQAYRHARNLPARVRRAVPLPIAA